MSFSTALVLGAGGQLGQTCIAAAPPEFSVRGLSKSECDLTDLHAVRRCLGDMAPAVVINAAAFTAVDVAESQPQLAEAINATGPTMLAAMCAEKGIRLVHISTDFVFDGSAASPYGPEAIPSPLGVYGASKLRGEQGVGAGGVSYAIVRTSWVYAPTGRNFLLTMLRLMREQGVVRVVNDQIGSPTAAHTLAAVCWALATHTQAQGLFHWSDRGAITWYDFACAIAEDALELGLLDAPARVEPIATQEYPTPAERPAYSVLDSTATCEALGMTQRPWREALRDVLGSLLLAQRECL